MLEDMSVTIHATTHALQHTLHHPSIISLFSEFSTPLDRYQVLELCPKGSLATFLHSRRPSVLSEDELRVVVKGVVNALTYLQTQQILHNSLSPDHILLTQDLSPVHSLPSKLPCMLMISAETIGLRTRCPTANS